MILEALNALRRGAVRDAINAMEEWRLKESLKWKKVAELLSWLSITRNNTVAEVHEACVKNWKKLRNCACRGVGCDHGSAGLVVEVFRGSCGHVAVPLYELERLCAFLIIKAADRISMEVV
jgi:hypothetical protein